MENYVFNAQALVFGVCIMVVCLILQGLAVVTVMSPVKSGVRRLVRNGHALLAQSVFFSGVIVLLLSHLAQIFVWGLSMHLMGMIEDPHLAMLFAGSTYTTVGFVNDPLARDWQLAAIIMATNGFFSFAWSTSAMFGLSRELYPGED